MEVPHEDYDAANVVAKALKEVQHLMRNSQFSTFYELTQKVDETLKRYEQYNTGGIKQLHAQLTHDAADAADANDLAKALTDMTAQCATRLQVCESSAKDLINDILPFVRDTSCILVHGSGNVLALAIACALQEHEGVHFFICEGLSSASCGTSLLEGSGRTLLTKVMETPEGRRLQVDKVMRYCTIIPDSAVGSIMSKVDFVVSGAYCVSEQGGLVHSTGSVQIATIAFTRNVPFYVLCETFKFAPIFPLSTEDLKQPSEATAVVPLVEFVPPSLITLFFSEEGIMTPSAVADHMFRVYKQDSLREKRK